MQITRREVEMMKYLNECGFCSMSQMKVKFNLSQTNAYRLLKKLKDEGLLKYKRKIHDSPGVYFLSNKGSEYSDLPVIGKVSAAKFDHQMMVNEVFIQLTKKYPEAIWISERQLMHEKFINGVGKTGHVCDGILIFEANKQIAVEVELNPKAQERIEKIVKGYVTQFKFQEVWYFCASSVLKMMTDLSAKYPFIKVFKLNEFISCKVTV